MIEAVVTARHTLAQAICSFELSRADGAPLPAFSAGAHIDVHLPNGLVRQYSLCSPTWELQHYTIGVLKDDASRGGSNAMHEQVHVGQRIMISAPRNLFPLVHDAEHTLLFAGGIGITPILCMAEELHRQGADFHLHYSARSAERAAFIERLRNSPFAERVHLHFDDQPSGQQLDANAVLAAPHNAKHLYVCGPNGYMAHILDTAKAQGWADACLHREYFAAQPSNNTDANSFSVQIKSSGQIIPVSASQTVAAALEAAGVFVPLSCEQGICGSCLTGVLAGEPDHRDQYLSPEEQASNNQFTPCCSRAKSALLLLDL